MTRLIPCRLCRYWRMLSVVKPYWVFLPKDKLLHKCLDLYENTYRYEIVMSAPPMTRSALEIFLSSSE
jgi:hypothetical protein